MSILLFKVVRGLLYVFKYFSRVFWHWYHLYYCIANNVIFKNKTSVRFNYHSIISINPSSNVKIGEAFIVNSGPESGIGTAKSKIIVSSGAKLVIGDGVGISSATILVNNSLTIGSYVNIGGGVFINDSNNHSTDWRDRSDRNKDVKNAKSAPIIIGDYCFIGARCMILKGVTIGEKTIIAAGSVVVKDIPANCIAGGNPCRVIKQLS